VKKKNIINGNKIRKGRREEENVTVATSLWVISGNITLKGTGESTKHSSKRLLKIVDMTKIGLSYIL